MRRRILIIVGCLELLALFLAQWQSLGHVRTDEAKYLLNIPYPHPQLLRTVMSWTEWLPAQEFFWRLLLASLMIQAVWLVWDMGKKLPLELRSALCASWLLCSAVIIQAGTVMLAPAVALDALALLWLRQRTDVGKRFPLLIAAVWLEAVFTSYQGVLFVPLAWSAFRKSGQSPMRTALYVFAPVALLALHSLSNPLALATMLIHKNDGAGLVFVERLSGVAKLWLVGGAGVIGAIGTWGILRSRDYALQLSLLLVVLYIAASIPYPFYAILFSPLFVAGILHVLGRIKHHERWSMPVIFAAGSVVVTFLFLPSQDHDAAREVMRAIDPKADAGPVLITGSFGHQWQYESRASVRRYKPEFAADAQAIVCLDECEPLFNTSGWKRLDDLPVEVWVKK